MDRITRISNVIAEFDAQGWHRTGTEVDAASGEWLKGHLVAAGVEAQLEPHEFPRCVPEEAFISWQGGRIEGLPAFDCGRTGAGGVVGRFGPTGSAAAIGFSVVTPGGPAPEFDDARAKGTHAAIVAVTKAGRPGLAPRNATEFPGPFGPPVLYVSSEHTAALESLAAAGCNVTVSAEAGTEAVTAWNVVGRVPGRHPGLPPMVVMTPRSGWWQGASERGGGIACWLEIARTVAERPLERDLLFVASTGHELGHWGLEQYLASRPVLAREAVLWLHLGASIGAALGPRPVAFGSDAELRELAVRCLKEAGVPPLTLAPKGAVPGGESRNIHERRGRYVSFLGSSEVFHLEADRWPEAVDVAAVDAYCSAAIAIIREASRLAPGSTASQTPKFPQS